MLRELGCRVLEADKIAHQMIEPGGAAYDEVVREFGAESYAGRPRGPVEAGAIVFADPERLARLNAIVHPPVVEAQDRRDSKESTRARCEVAVVEAALLIEAGFDKKLECLVVTWCTPEQQLARLTKSRHGPRADAREAGQRIAAQMPHGRKTAHGR